MCLSRLRIIPGFSDGVASASIQPTLVCVSLGTIKYSNNANVIRPSLDARERSALRVSPDLMLLLPVCRYESEF